MKLFAVHTKTESCDDGYETIASKKKPTTKQLDKWLKDNNPEEYEDGICSIYIEEIWEIKEKGADKI